MHATTFATSSPRPCRRALSWPRSLRLADASDAQLIITACILLAFVAGVVAFAARFSGGIDALALAGV